MSAATVSPLSLLSSLCAVPGISSEVELTSMRWMAMLIKAIPTHIAKNAEWIRNWWQWNWRARHLQSKYSSENVRLCERGHSRRSDKKKQQSSQSRIKQMKLHEKHWLRADNKKWMSLRRRHCNCSETTKHYSNEFLSHARYQIGDSATKMNSVRHLQYVSVCIAVGVAPWNIHQQNFFPPL